MVKRVEKHMTEESVKAKLRVKLKQALIVKLENAIHEVIPERELTPWPS